MKITRKQIRQLVREATLGAKNLSKTADAFAGGDIGEDMFVDVEEESLLNVNEKQPGAAGRVSDIEVIPERKINEAAAANVEMLYKKYSGILDQMVYELYLKIEDLADFHDIKLSDEDHYSLINRAVEETITDMKVGRAQTMSDDFDPDRPQMRESWETDRDETMADMKFRMNQEDDEYMDGYHDALDGKGIDIGASPMYRAGFEDGLEDAPEGLDDLRVYMPPAKTSGMGRRQK